ncbi:MAG: hypothetical protein NVS3B18_08690 [Candidatus Dormibacteria bacterium]
MYLATSTTRDIAAAMRAGQLGRVCTPNGGGKAEGAWCADNGAFSDKWDADKWWAWLQANAADAATCLFAALPDVVGDWAATLDRSLPWIPKVRALGYPLAIVLQDGATPDTVPWDDIDAVFIGGSTAWKLGPEARQIVAEAKRRGLWVHMGRVNSERRLRYAKHIGCDSADGTYLSFGPDVNLPRLQAWLRGVNDQGDLFGAAV